MALQRLRSLTVWFDLGTPLRVTVGNSSAAMPSANACTLGLAAKASCETRIRRREELV